MKSLTVPLLNKIMKINTGDFLPHLVKNSFFNMQKKKKKRITCTKIEIAIP